MQRLDQVLRELQPVLKTLNDKSNALVFEAKDKRSRAEEGETMKKWLVVMMAVWLTSCSSNGENKSYYQLPIAQGAYRVALTVVTACCGLSRWRYRITRR